MNAVQDEQHSLFGCPVYIRALESSKLLCLGQTKVPLVGAQCRPNVAGRPLDSHMSYPLDCALSPGSPTTSGSHLAPQPGL